MNRYISIYIYGIQGREYWIGLNGIGPCGLVWKWRVYPIKIDQIKKLSGKYMGIPRFSIKLGVPYLPANTFDVLKYALVCMCRVQRMRIENDRKQEKSPLLYIVELIGLPSRVCMGGPFLSEPITNPGQTLGSLVKSRSSWIQHWGANCVML